MSDLETYMGQSSATVEHEGAIYEYLYNTYNSSYVVSLRSACDARFGKNIPDFGKNERSGQQS